MKRIRLKPQTGSKIAPIRSISLYDEFVQVNGSPVWMLKKEVLNINGIKFNNTPELVVRKNTYYSKFTINEKQNTLDSIFRTTRPRHSSQRLC